MLNFPVPTAGPTPSDRPGAVTIGQTWSELSEHRRLWLARAMCSKRFELPSHRPCRTPYPIGTRTSRQYVRLGTDGRFHMLESEFPGLPCGVEVHSDSYYWARRNGEYRVHAPSKEGDLWESGQTSVDWAVTFARDAADVPVWSVSTADRCPYSIHDSWQMPSDASPLGRIRETLLETFGDACAVCGERDAFVVDHCWLTGRVRGYVCRGCNDFIEGCAHVSGCRAAEYLDHPPAWPMKLTYPRFKERRARGERGRAKWAQFLSEVASTPDIASLAHLIVK